MCTVTWIREAEGYQLFCNRDEKRTRKPASPPGIAIQNGVRFLAPLDGDFGGTWIATNEFGLTLCLLNGARAVAARSRGLLVLDLAHLESVASVVKHVRKSDLQPYAPFTMAVLAPGACPVIIEWSGSRTTVAAPEGPHFLLTSSSFDGGGVREKRREEYARLTGAGCSAELLAAFHRSHGGPPSAHSVCMHRPDAETVSFSHIRVSPSQTEFAYISAAPCLESQSQSVRLSIGRHIANVEDGMPTMSGFKPRARTA